VSCPSLEFMESVCDAGEGLLLDAYSERLGDTGEGEGLLSLSLSDREKC
jgi:hypothetical protein